MEQNKKNTSTFIYLFTLLVLVAVSMFSYYNSRSPQVKRFRYKGYGIPMPGNYQIHGIDLSHYQANVNWQDIKQMEFNHIKIGFAFIKATEGADRVDNNFISNWYGAKQMEIPIGAYHFFFAGTNGKAQAQNFIDIVSLGKDDLPPVLDIEDANDIKPKELVIEIQDWLNAVEKNYHVKPIIYTNINFFNAYLKGKFEDYPLWIANYTFDTSPDIDEDWVLWQHSQTGHVDGIGGFVDFNVFNGDSTAFRNFLLK